VQTFTLAPIPRMGHLSAVIREATETDRPPQPTTAAAIMLDTAINRMVKSATTAAQVPTP
ncbi:hypothetical protein J0O71_14875, partial [Listeria monocytogenes]|nr:hypothetical protein [Listeria monocytogenes]